MLSAAQEGVGLGLELLDGDVGKACRIPAASTGSSLSSPW
jgi:hypothetical protein